MPAAGNSRGVLFRMSELTEAKQRLGRFAEAEAARSPLYSHLAASAATDDDVAGLLTAAAEPDPALLLAAAHRLLQADPIHPLTRYYPTLGGFDGVDSQTWPLFRRFLLEHVEAARELIGTRVPRNNEVQRAAVLYPAIAIPAKRAAGPIALLEVGCAGGLLLGLDRFAYRYQCDGGEQFAAGPAKAAVGLHCAVEGAGFRKPPKKLAVDARIGLDPAPIDVGDEDELAWLEACVPADQPERVRLLRTASAALRKQPPELVTGDAVEELAPTAARVPAELPLVVVTSHALCQLDERRRADFVSALGELAGGRPLSWVANEPTGGGLELVLPAASQGAYTLAVTHWKGGEPVAEELAHTDSRGQRMSWL